MDTNKISNLKTEETVKNSVSIWEVEEITSKELEMLTEELLSGCGFACGGHNINPDK